MKVEQLTPDKIEEWKTKLREAKEAQLTLLEFKKLYELSDYNYNILRARINDEELCSFPRKGWPKGKSRPVHKSPKGLTGNSFYKAKREYEEAIGHNYLAIPMEQAEQQPQATLPKHKPVFCLMLAFDSKQEALAAMGEYL